MELATVHLSLLCQSSPLCCILGVTAAPEWMRKGGLQSPQDNLRVPGSTHKMASDLTTAAWQMLALVLRTSLAGRGAVGPAAPLLQHPPPRSSSLLMAQGRGFVFPAKTEAAA